MGGKEDIVLDNCMVPDVVAAPQRHIGSDLCEWLNRIVFEDEAVFFHIEVRESGSTTADVRRQPISLGTGGGYFCSPQLVDPGIADRNEQSKTVRWKGVGCAFKRNDRPPMEAVFLEISFVDSEARNREGGIVPEIEISDLRDIAGAEDNDVLHYDGRSRSFVNFGDQRPVLYRRRSPPAMQEPSNLDLNAQALLIEPLSRPRFLF